MKKIDLLSFTPTDFKKMYRKHKLLPSAFNNAVYDGKCCGIGVLAIELFCENINSKQVAVTDFFSKICSNDERFRFEDGFLDRNSSNFKTNYSNLGYAVGQHCRKVFPNAASKT